MKDAPGPGPTRDPSRGRPRLSSGQEFAGLGMQFAGAMGLFGLLGWWLDGKLGTAPWLLILLIFVGAGAAFYSMYQRVFGGAGRSSSTGGSRPGGAGDARRDGGER